MGQKVSPHGLRVGVIKDWDSKWYASKANFADMLVEDNQIRTYIKKKLYAAGVAKVLVERPAENKVRVTALVARPGMVIGRNGTGADEVKAALVKLTDKNVDLDIQEVKKSELDAQLTAESVAQSLERRVSFRRAMKQAIQRSMKSGAKGVKIVCAGRLGGAEIARSEKYSEGNVPLHTIRADIDYGFAEADTTYGKIGIKVWINHGEILEKGLQSPIREEKKEKTDRKGGRRDRREGDRRDRRSGSRKEEGDRSRRERAPRDNKPAIPKAANTRVRPVKAAPAPAEAEAAELEGSQVDGPQAEGQVEAAEVEEAVAPVEEAAAEAAQVAEAPAEAAAEAEAPAEE